MQNLGNIFLYNNNRQNKAIYHQELEPIGYFLFDTDNLHKFTFYHKEIIPHVMLFDFAAFTSLEYITAIESKLENTSIPIIVVSEAPQSLIYHPNISHYLSHKEARKSLREILETYCVGNKRHHILYINLKPYERSDFSKSVTESEYTMFEVHTINAARQYIQKNTPTIICVNFLPNLHQSPKLFSFPKTFYVDNTQNIKEVKQFLH